MCHCGLLNSNLSPSCGKRKSFSDTLFNIPLKPCRFSVKSLISGAKVSLLISVILWKETWKYLLRNILCKIDFVQFILCKMSTTSQSKFYLSCKIPLASAQQKEVLLHEILLSVTWKCKKKNNWWLLVKVYGIHFK